MREAQTAADGEPEIDETVTPAEIEQATRNTTKKLLVLLAVGSLLFLGLRFTPLGTEIRDWDTLARLFQAGDLNAELYFLALSAFLIMAGVPRLLFSALGGFVFGFWQGLLWSLLASLIGSFVTFQAARWGGRAWLQAHFGGQRIFRRIVHAEPSVLSVALIRMLPIANVMVNVGLALSRVDRRAFLLGSLFGFLPQGVIATAVGSGLAHDSPWLGALQIGLASLVILALVRGLAKYRRSKRRPGTAD
jgi:uncharacterized membrane protein YdjX (TVP38/TMEM64 family)